MKMTLLVAVLALACIVGVQAQDDACNGDDYGNSGTFDFYVFAQSWPAQFCQKHQDWPGCSSPTQWQQTNLTLHGMWPNYAQSSSGHGWPQCCTDTTAGFAIDPTVATSLLPELQTYWPNEQDPTGGDLSNSLWAHEWQKHGTCSGLGQQTYFQSAMNIELSMPTPSVITASIGGNIQLADLQAAYNATGCTEGSDCIVGFNCNSQDGNLYLEGVTTCWDPTFKQIVCPAAVISSQGKECTQSTVYIQSF